MLKHWNCYGDCSRTPPLNSSYLFLHVKGFLLTSYWNHVCPNPFNSNLFTSSLQHYLSAKFQSYYVNLCNKLLKLLSATCNPTKRPSIRARLRWSSCSLGRGTPDQQRAVAWRIGVKQADLTMKRKCSRGNAAAAMVSIIPAIV